MALVRGVDEAVSPRYTFLMLFYSFLFKLNLLQAFTEVLKGDNLVVCDFYAKWCGPCKMLAPKLEAMASEHKNIQFVKVDVDECQVSLSVILRILRFICSTFANFLGACGYLPY